MAMGSLSGLSINFGNSKQKFKQCACLFLEISKLTLNERHDEVNRFVLEVREANI